MTKYAIVAHLCLVLAVTDLVVPALSFVQHLPSFPCAVQRQQTGGRLDYVCMGNGKASATREYHVMSASEKNYIQDSRRQVVKLAAAMLLFPTPSMAKTAAPLSGADPADKQALLDAVTTIQGLEEKVKDPSSWKQAADIVGKPPFTKEAFDKLFTKAAKSLPDNIQKIYGGDGGQWIGIKNEAVDAMDAFSAELTYLLKNKGTDTTDLTQYYALVKSKSEEFVALYSNSEINKQLKGVGYCAYSSSAKCDAFDDNKDVQEQKKGGGIYNQLRFGATERKFGGGVDDKGNATQ